MVEASVVMWVQTAILVIQAAIMAIAAVFVFRQLKEHSEEIASTHDWNRRLASQHAAYEFMEPKIHEYWVKVQKSVIDQRKPYAELSPEEQHAVRQILNFFESLAIALKHNIVEWVIIYDFFGYVWPLSADCAKSYIDESQQEDESLYENLVRYAREFSQRTEELRAPNEPRRIG